MVGNLPSYIASYSCDKMLQIQMYYSQDYSEDHCQNNIYFVVLHEYNVMQSTNVIM